ncbi:MAG: hypothetical protein EZS28_040600, partial [Streblomastix strix]
NIETNISMRTETDNSVAAFNIQKGATAIQLANLIDRVIQEAEAFKIQISARYVPRMDNTIADSQFRLETGRIYMINCQILTEALYQLQVCPSIDAFTNRRNRKCRRFCSLIVDLWAIKQDGLSSAWNREVPLIHPQIPLIQRSHNKISNEGCLAVFIHHCWNAQPWWVDLQSIKVNSIIFGQCKELLEAGSRMKKKRRHMPAGLLQISIVEGKKEKMFTKQYKNKRFQRKQAQKEQSVASIVSSVDIDEELVNIKKTGSKQEEI